MKFCRFPMDVHRANGYLKLDNKKFDCARILVEYFLLLATNIHITSILIFLLVETEADFAEKMVNFTYLITCFDGMIKVWHGRFRGKFFVELCEDLSDRYNTIEKKYDIPDHLSAEVLEKKLNKFSKLLFFYPMTISLTAAMVAMFVQPQVDEETGLAFRRLPVVAWYPFDLHISPNYELVFMIQAIALYCVALGINGHLITCFTLMAYTRRSFMLLQHFLKNIQFKISPEAKECIRNRENLKYDESGNRSENEAETTTYQNIKLSSKCSIHAHPEECAFYEKKAHDEMDQQLKDFIVYHAKLLRFFKNVNIYGRFLLFCDTLLAIGLLVMGTVALLESETVAEAAYLSGWEDGGLSFQKSIAIVMSRAQRGESLTVGNLYPADLDLYITLMQAAYSNFTLLRSLTGRDQL